MNTKIKENKEERSFPTLVDKSVGSRMEALKQLKTRKDSKLIESILGTLFVSLMSMVLRSTKKGSSLLSWKRKKTFVFWKPSGTSGIVLKKRKGGSKK
ncbi:MAG: IFRD domain-containing protein [Candidatus Magasanikbacteria bacterium]|nr:IFRD domain-containing protein [Candidatus Magasanikbacteria bacterium]